MTPVILIEVVLVFGSTLIWGLYQLYQLRRDRREQAIRNSHAASAAGEHAAADSDLPAAPVSSAASPASPPESAAPTAPADGPSNRKDAVDEPY